MSRVWCALWSTTLLVCPACDELKNPGADDEAADAGPDASPETLADARPPSPPDAGPDLDEPGCVWPSAGPDQACRDRDCQLEHPLECAALLHVNPDGCAPAQPPFLTHFSDVALETGLLTPNDFPGNNWLSFGGPEEGPIIEALPDDGHALWVRSADNFEHAGASTGQSFGGPGRDLSIRVGLRKQGDCAAAGDRACQLRVTLDEQPERNPGAPSDTRIFFVTLTTGTPDSPWQLACEYGTAKAATSLDEVPESGALLIDLVGPPDDRVLRAQLGTQRCQVDVRSPGRLGHLYLSRGGVEAEGRLLVESLTVRATPTATAACAGRRTPLWADAACTGEPGNSGHALPAVAVDDTGRWHLFHRANHSRHHTDIGYATGEGPTSTWTVHSAHDWLRDGAECGPSLNVAAVVATPGPDPMLRMWVEFDAEVFHYQVPAAQAASPEAWRRVSEEPAEVAWGDADPIAWLPVSVLQDGEALIGYALRPGEDGRRALAVARSEDGVHWIGDPTPILEGATTDDAWDRSGLDQASVFRGPQGVFMAAWSSRAEDSAGIGLAVSDDGVSWTRLEDNPRVRGMPETLEGRFSAGLSGVVDGHRIWLWYGGLARSTLGCGDPTPLSPAEAAGCGAARHNTATERVALIELSVDHRR
jgi:hypothetical protein